ncbi:c-type cytochrome [Chitinophaga agrisoli]|uniref:C-type cytochrome n=1 Tax=Chitinophaga agrisoli TaxID=2607653 RepID=A0A5B2VKW0_9BACT|nr:c-type cytochrome [Chitinophaga agrisoli]KAA2239156.1 c-type cytochrome [Chitinophaga agrisoli]
MKNWFYTYSLLAAGALWMTACQSNPPETKDKKQSDSLAMREKYAESPTLDPETSLQHIQVEKGLKVQLVAAEPQVSVPVAMTFDERGRMWVVEMMGYMPDTVGTGEDMRNGRVVILEDANHDGTVDTRTTFTDSLVLPRAICMVENGILVAEPPKLWFIENDHDRAGKKTLVDDKYAEGGNVEHQPNGLFRAMDNWIYNAKSDKRYRKAGNKWLIEHTHFRGQWGISQDNYGRLFYNNNSENLLGDYFSPGLGASNEAQKNVAGYDEHIVPDNRVYPIRATPGVNRGYMKGVLDDSLRLVNFTAACGVLIYRANLLGDGFEGNAFVAEPSANLIKRNLLQDSGYIVKGEQAYKEREFLASTDERFRPVNLYEGPDGALYILDMYRGIIQHKTYLTPYLRNEIKTRRLTTPLNCGRIYRVVPEKDTAVQMVTLENDPAKLLALLDHPNGWVRDKAQQMIVDNHYTTLAPQLRERLRHDDPKKPWGLLHAMWTLEGLGQLQLADVTAVIQQANPYLRVQALAAMPAVITPQQASQVLSVIAPLQQSVLQAPSIALLLPYIKKVNAAAASQLQTQLLHSYASDRYVADAIISNNAGHEQELLQQVTKWNADTNLVITRRLQKTIKDAAKQRNAKANAALAKLYPRGNHIFKTVCQTCHGADGEGIQSLAPPLNQSQWVLGDKNKMISIVLYGLTGPVPVNGKVYKAPEVSGEMPGIGSNDEFSDDDIAQVISFIRNAWTNKAEKVTEKDIQQIRQQYKGRQKSFTVEELK